MSSVAGGLLEGFADAADGGRRAFVIRQAITLGIVAVVVLLYRLTGSDGSHDAALSSFLLPVLIPLVPLHRHGVARLSASRPRDAQEVVAQA